jgi:hypothetical protein
VSTDVAGCFGSNSSIVETLATVFRWGSNASQKFSAAARARRSFARRTHCFCADAYADWFRADYSILEIRCAVNAIRVVSTLSGVLLCGNATASVSTSTALEQARFSALIASFGDSFLFSLRKKRCHFHLQ